MASARLVLGTAFLVLFTWFGGTPVSAQDQPPNEPKTVSDVVDEANELLKAGDFSAAAELYGKVVNASPSFVPALIGRAKCLDALGESQLALSTASNAVNYASRHHPKLMGDARALRAKLLIDIGNYQDAVDGMDAAVLQDPANADFLLVRASALRQLVEAAPNLGRPENDQKRLLFALSSLNRAAKLDNTKPTQQKVLFERGLIKVALGRNDEARDDIQSSFEDAGLEPEFAKMIARQLASRKQVARQASKVETALRK